MSISISLYFKKIGDSFVPTHVSEIKIGDIFYVVNDGVVSNQLLKATADAVQSSAGEWALSSVEEIGNYIHLIDTKFR